MHRAAQILDNPEEQPAAIVRRRYRDLLRRMTDKAPHRRWLTAALKHFGKVTRSYWPGLFHCYDVPDLPRTNNDLEHLFGSTRHHERRCTGRKVASPSLVLRGSVRVVAGLGSRTHCPSGPELAPANLQDWQTLRQDLEQRRSARVQRCRFRRNPQAYLQDLEDLLLKPPLPP